VRKTPDGLRLSDRFDGTPLSSINGFGIFFDKAGETTPIVFSQFAIKLTAMPEVTVFFHLRPLETPSVPPSKRHTVSRLAIPHCYRLVVRYGYNDEVVTPDLASVIYEQLRLYILCEQKGTTSLPAPPRSGVSESGEENSTTTTTGSSPKIPDAADMPPTTTPNEKTPQVQSTTHQDPRPHHNAEKSPAEALARLDRAFGYKVMYIVGKEQMKIKRTTGPFRRMLLVLFLWMKDNSRTKMANLNVPTEKVIEVGFLKEI
jgi:KUP system potassium uptake protein